MSLIHPMAIVDPKAKIADDVEIGPFCTIGPNVEIGSGTKLVSHCNVSGYTTIGENNKISQFVSLGTAPQDVEWKGEPSYLKIGSGNLIREGFTANVGTKPGSSTVIGNDCFFMINSHVAHNVQVGNNVILVNGALVGGYVELADKCILSGNTAVHQFCKVGRLAMLGGNTPISKDLPPFTMCFSITNTVGGINLIGMKRDGFSKETIRAIKNVFKIFYRSRIMPKQAVEQVLADKNLAGIPEVLEFLAFVKSSKRGILASHIDYRKREKQED